MKGLVQRTVAATLVAAAVVLLGAGPSSAHAVLVSTDPTDGATLEQLPAKVSLTFNENIGAPAYVVVLAPDGTKAETGSTEVLDHTVSRTTKDLDIAGRYAMSYRVVSADGHTVEGTIHFTVSEGRVVKEKPAVTEERSFVHRHAAHIAWGAAGVVVAILLLVVPTRRKHETDR